MLLGLPGRQGANDAEHIGPDTGFRPGFVAARHRLSRRWPARGHKQANQRGFRYLMHCFFPIPLPIGALGLGMPVSRSNAA